MSHGLLNASAVALHLFESLIVRQEPTMLRIAFAVLVIVHGLIHLFGFVKAFELTKVDQLSQSISKPLGLLWLFVGLLIGVATIAFLSRKELWWLFAFAAIVLSQFLIVLHWQDAKFGSIANAIILLVCLPGFGSWRFDSMIKTEVIAFVPKGSDPSPILTGNAISHLPGIVQSWLRNSNVIGKPMATTAHVHQVGRMKLKPDGAWMTVNAEQWFTTGTPGFLWSADVGDGSLIQFSGRDKLAQGKGSMLIALYSLIPIVDAAGPSIDQGAMVRYLAEIIWFPSAALSRYIVWEELDSTMVRATLTYNNLSVVGTFTFNDQARPLRFQAERFYDKTQTLETWRIDIDEHKLKSFNEVVIPTHATVTWQLKNGDFTWFEVEIKDLVIH